MKKIVALNLKEIKYSGDSIGDDVFIEIRLADQIFKLDQKIKHGADTKINIEIAYFETKENLLELPIYIKITEDDVLFDDVGEIKGIVKINLSEPLPQNQVFKVKVSESKSSISRRTAFFQITLEIGGAIRYISDTDDQGWLIVILDNNGKEFSTPINLKVQLDHRDRNREYFTVLEGTLKNTKASVLLKRDDSSRFSRINPHKKQVNLTYSISKKTLKFGKKVYKTIDYSDAPWTKGVYNIEIPDNPHRGGWNYLNKAPHATTWFRIAYLNENDRYVHTGERSLGCITLIESGRWEELYSVFISARKGDGFNIGTIEITD